MKAVMAIECCPVLAHRPTFETGKLASSISVDDLSVRQFCFDMSLFHDCELREFVVVLANVEGKGVSIGQVLSANIALMLRVSVAGENLFLVMHRDQVKVEQILVLGLLITEITREQFRRLWWWRRGRGCGYLKNFFVCDSITRHHCWCSDCPILLFVSQVDRIPPLLLQQSVGHSMPNPQVNPFLSISNASGGAVNHSVAEAAGRPIHQVAVTFFDLKHEVLPAAVPQQIGVGVPFHTTYLAGPRRSTCLPDNLGLLDDFGFFDLWAGLWPLDWAVYNRIESNLKSILISFLLLRSECA